MNYQLNNNRVTIERAGFSFTGACACDGRNTLKFKVSTDYGEFLIKLRQRDFSYSVPGSRPIKKDVSELENILIEIKNHEAFQKYLQKKAEN